MNALVERTELEFAAFHNRQGGFDCTREDPEDRYGGQMETGTGGKVLPPGWAASNAIVVNMRERGSLEKRSPSVPQEYLCVDAVGLSIK